MITSSAFEIQVDFNNNNQYQIIEPYEYNILQHELKSKGLEKLGKVLAKCVVVFQSKFTQ